MAQIFFPVTSSFLALNSSDSGFKVSFISQIYTCTSSAEYCAGISSFNAVHSLSARFQAVDLQNELRAASSHFLHSTRARSSVR